MWSLSRGKSWEHQHPKVPATGVLLTKHHRNRGNSICAAEVVLASRNCLDQQLMLKGTSLPTFELVLFLAELHQWNPFPPSLSQTDIPMWAELRSWTSGWGMEGE